MPNHSVLDVHLHDRLIGTLTRLPGDRNLFAFTQDYADDPKRLTLSLNYRDAFGSLITEAKPVQTRLPPFFANLLPEGSMRDYLAKRAHVNPLREFFLAWELGHDLPGALKIVSSEKDIPIIRHLPLPASDKTEDDLDSLHFSLAGVQLKFSAVHEAQGGLTIPVHGVGGSWIVKLPSTKFEDVPENEYAMMELARRVGIEVPQTELFPINRIRNIPSGVEGVGNTAFAIKRFDRSDDGGAVHMEDFAQVFGVYPEDKYARANYGNIAQVLWVESGEVGISEFLRRLVFSVLIGNGDMHLKNWSLIYPDGHNPQLSPAYDFVSTIAYIQGDKLALNLADEKSFDAITTDHFLRLAAKVGLPENLTRHTVNDTVARFREVWLESSDISIPARIRDALDRHLLTLPLWQ